MIEDDASSFESDGFFQDTGDTQQNVINFMSEQKLNGVTGIRTCMDNGSTPGQPTGLQNTGQNKGKGNDEDESYRKELEELQQ